jgi:serine/threonine protein kinase
MSLTDDRWSAAERLFHEAASLEEAARTELLDRECAGDPDLRREVEDLLAADRDATHHSALHGIATGWLTGITRADMIGRTVGPYHLQSIIASGGMGDVYLADEAALGRKVAVKLLPESFARDPERVRRFTDEARAISALNHPHIVVIHQIGDAEGRPYLATEFVEGETLRARIARGPLPLVDALAIAMQIAGAIEAAHAAGIVHRDLKPENVMFDDKTGVVKLLDFGIATDTDTSPEQRLTRAGFFVGTLMYVAPEALSGELVTPAADQYSLATIAYFLLSGCLPYTAKTPREMFSQLLSQPPIPLNAARPGMKFPAAVESVIMRGLAKEPPKRYATTVEFATALRDAVAQPAAEERAGLFGRIKQMFGREEQD